MVLSALPFNSGPDTKPALARQMVNFVSEIVRRYTSEEINTVNYLIRLEEGPQPRFANVNPSETLNEWQMVEQFFPQTNADALLDGLLVTTGDSHTLTYRFFKKGEETPAKENTLTFTSDACFPAIRTLIEDVAAFVGTSLPAEVAKDEELFGTDRQAAFLKFLEGFDAIQYIEKTQGQVALEFQPQGALDCFQEAVEADKDWEGPYLAMIQLVRLCTQSRIGTYELLRDALAKLGETVPSDARAMFAQGELAQAVGDLAEATQLFEKAHTLDANEPAILARLGIVQMQMQMPANAERNFRKAIEMEGDDKPSMDLLAAVLQQTNRIHEVPSLYKAMIDADPQNASAHARYATALIAAGQEADGEKAFEAGLETVTDSLPIKRFFAPYLAQNKQDFDRAMDFYEDVLDVAPTDVQILWEYAQTLNAAGRQFEIPKVLRDILGTDPEPNTRSNVLAWLIELEQPKRVETVANAERKMQNEDYDGAIRDLKPMRNWLADYWKMWLLLAAAFNRTQQHEEAEEAATRLVNMYPGLEPAYAELVASLSAQEKTEEAYNAMRFAMTQIPNSVPVAVNLALAAKRSGRDEEARHLARQIREAIGENKELEPVFAEIER
ncbi:MAG TPA: tetratricopeptide repeat protein [Fimbriimonadaceae bacterium]|nr:tetratricopeptide repeat protein [Fimbriimonadaceae bacterium]